MPITKELDTSLGKVTVRGIKHGEMKQLRQQGIDLSKSEEDVDRAAERVAAVLKFALPPELAGQVDEFYEGEVTNIFLACMDLTFPKAEQEKN